jgi:endonuclease V-like protein UPF0215 family
MRPHVLGIDDAPFRKGQAEDVPIIGVMMEGATLVEGVALGAFPVDGDGVTAYLAGWVLTQRWHPALQAVVLGGITIAGLALVDIRALSEQLGVPVLVATRQDTATSTLGDALRAAGHADRLGVLHRSPPARPLAPGLFVAWAGCEAAAAEALVRATLLKARVPEPLRVAHLIGAALVQGVSRGRV